MRTHAGTDADPRRPTRRPGPRTDTDTDADPRPTRTAPGTDADAEPTLTRIYANARGVPI